MKKYVASPVFELRAPGIGAGVDSTEPADVYAGIVSPSLKRQFSSDSEVAARSRGSAAQTGIAPTPRSP